MTGLGLWPRHQLRPLAVVTGCVRQACSWSDPGTVFLINRCGVWGVPDRLAAGMDHESDQVPEEHLVDALALRGDEGRGTLR